MANLSQVYLRLAKFEEAEKLIIDSLKMLKDSLPVNHPNFIRGRLTMRQSYTIFHRCFCAGVISVGKLYVDLGQYEKAETELRKAWEMIESAFLTDHQIACYGK